MYTSCWRSEAAVERSLNAWACSTVGQGDEEVGGQGAWQFDAAACQAAAGRLWAQHPVPGLYHGVWQVSKVLGYP